METRDGQMKSQAALPPVECRRAGDRGRWWTTCAAVVVMLAAPVPSLGGEDVERTASPQEAEEVEEATGEEDDLARRPSLETVSGHALTHNPAIRAARRAWEAAKQRIPQARSYENPMVTWSPDTGNLAETRAGPQGRGVGVSQAVPFPGKLSMKGRIAEREARAAGERLRAVEQEVTRQVRARYAEMLLASHSLEINRAVTDLARQFAEIAEAKYRVGKAAQQDVIQAREEIARLSIARVGFEADHDTAVGALNALLDRPTEAPFGVPEDLDVAPLGISFADLLAAAAGRRPELLAQDQRTEASRRALTLAKMGYLPDFRIGGQYTSVDGGTNPMFAKDGQDVWMASVGLSIPIWIDRVEAGIEEKRAQVLENESMRRDLGNRVADEVQRAYERASAAAETEAILRTTLIPQTDARISAARAGYENNQVDFLTLVSSLKSLEQARLDRHRAVRAYHQSLADLERATGTAASDFSKLEGAMP